MQLRRVVVDAKGTRVEEFVRAVAATPEPDAEHAGAAGREQVPDRVADHVTVLRPNAKGRLTGEEEVRFGLGPGDGAAIDHHGVVTDSERVERQVDLGPAARSCDPVRDAPAAKVLEQLPGPGQRAPVRKQLAKDGAVSELDVFDLLSGELTPDLACDAPREQAAAHSDSTMDSPAVDRHPFRGKRALPGENVCIDRVDKRPVEVEDQGPCRHLRSLTRLGRHQGPANSSTTTGIRRLVFCAYLS